MKANHVVALAFIFALMTLSAFLFIETIALPLIRMIQ